MASHTRKPVRNSKNGTAKKSLRQYFTDQRVWFTLAVLLMIFTLYLAIAFISFIFSGDADQSKLEIKWSELVFNPEIRVENKAGKTGAWLADVIINRWFGIPSFLLLYLMTMVGFRMAGFRIRNYRKTILLTIISLLWLSVTLGLLFAKSEGGSFLYPGGKYGFVVSTWISAMIGQIGTGLLLFGLAFLVAGLSFRGLVPWLIYQFRERAERARERRETRAAEREARKSEEIPVPRNRRGVREVEPEPAISKVIDDEDAVTAIFDPDDQELPSIPLTPPADIHMEIEVSQAVETHIEPVAPPAPADGEHLPESNGEEELPADPNLPPYDPTLDLSGYRFPTLELLDEHKMGNAEVSNEELISNKNKIVETLRHYKIEITKIRATIGPTITLYEIVPAPGIRIVKIKNLEDDIALSLAALGIRIIAPIPGRGTIGIEVPNQNPEVVSMKSILSSKKFTESTAELPVALGKTISNETYMFDLTKMPHILVAGATGQGKSVGLNVIIASLLYKKHPTELKFVFIDPKKVELNLYSVLEKHYLAKLPNEEEPIINDFQKVKFTLNSLNVEMDQRYDLLKKAHTRNVKEYNDKFIQRRLNPEKGHRYLPYIVVVIDEFADLIMTAGKEIELPIARIAQLARAVGIHMIIATQRPSTNIITGTIKANFPARIAFKVASMIDSRTILDTPGANQLVGKGDMLISWGSAMTRVQCAFLDTPEVENICKFIGDQRGFPTAFLLPEVEGDEEGALVDADLSGKDELFDDAARLVVMNQLGSTSMIQRKLAIGYNRAGRIMDQLEKAGIVGTGEGSKPRQVYIQDEYSLEQLLKNIQ
ncbi:MAG TPA: DNA translocase FtsK 4TM domain-containing protein [Prolixibacteraceae bacterium]|jgi:S-DNA-T family DNA segregation ATPase FtsK/SpoIIIE|nr:DNA translocase FtsK [Bacteroidales bacterium]HRV88850.1 DNA translocase FtsK 4TM domain-containing protein [Prolixibacteraceae bacterium]